MCLLRSLPQQLVPTLTPGHEALVHAPNGCLGGTYKAFRVPKFPPGEICMSPARLNLVKGVPISAWKARLTSAASRCL